MKRDDAVLFAIASILNDRLGPLYDQINVLETRAAELESRQLAAIDIVPERGESGPKGDKGDKGDQGDRGEAEKGDKGDQGDKGDAGDKGDKGDKGDSGTQGEKGDVGPKGDSGDKGDRGEQGESIRGEQGGQGEKGDRGDQGVRGETGLRGLAGDQGARGDDGILPEVYDWVPGQYERAAAVTHRGGTWQAKCRTNEEPGQRGGGEWRCIARGLADIEVEETDQPRLKKIILILTDGATISRDLRIQIPLHMKVWEPDRDYNLNDEVAWGRGSYRAMRNGLKGVEPGRTEDWAAVAMSGKKGDKGDHGDRGPLGLSGARGERGEQGEKGDQGLKGDAAVLGSFLGPYEAGMEIKRDGIVSHGPSLWLSLVDEPLSPPALHDPSWKRLLSLPVASNRRVS